MATPPGKKHLKERLHAFRRSVWFFPVVAGACLLLLTAFKISGTSIGIYHNLFYNGHKDTNLLTGVPRAVRSDEWLVNTEMTIAQSRAGFPQVNPNITGGRDMSLNLDVPYLDWSIIFKPQNLSFFVLPLEYAFALKWWLLLYLLMMGAYFFCLRLLPGKRLLGSMAAIAFACSPFVFWWYQTVTIAPLFYGLFIMILGMRLVNRERLTLFRRQLAENTSFAIYGVTLAYLLTSFVLVLYPPFQVPAALVTGFFLLGYALHHGFGQKGARAFGSLVKPFLTFMAAALVAGLLVFSFIATRSAAFHSIANTVYPGQRIVASGDFPAARVLSTFLQPQLQHGAYGQNYYSNQSESSNFILLLPYLLLPGILLTIYEIVKYRRLDWIFLCVQLCVALFFAHLFLASYHQGIYHVLQLDKVPHTRLLIGLGFVGFVHLLLLIKKLPALRIGRIKLTILAAVYTLGCFGVTMIAAKDTALHFPLFVPQWWLIIGAAGFFCGIIYMLLIRRFMLAMGMLVFFSVFSIVHVHPLYRGLGPILDNKVISTMQQVSQPGDSWATMDEIYAENFGILANRNMVSGTQFYPDLTFWRQAQGPQADDIYNRYAHVLFTAEPAAEPLELMQPDMFKVHVTCSPFIRHNVDYLLTTKPFQQPCVRQVGMVAYPNATTFYMYKVE